MRTLLTPVLLANRLPSASVFAVVSSPVSADLSGAFYTCQLSKLINQNTPPGSIESGSHNVGFIPLTSASLAIAANVDIAAQVVPDIKQACEWMLLAVFSQTPRTETCKHSRKRASIQV